MSRSRERKTLIWVSAPSRWHSAPVALPSEIIHENSTIKQVSHGGCQSALKTSLARLKVYPGDFPIRQEEQGRCERMMSSQLPEKLAKALKLEPVAPSLPLAQMPQLGTSNEQLEQIQQ